MIYEKRPPFPLLVLLLGLQGCDRHINNANLNEVKPDMNVKEVEAILGPPTRTEFSPPEPKSQEVVKTVAITHYIYEQNGKTVKLTFVGDRLASGGVEGSFEK